MASSGPICPLGAILFVMGVVRFSAGQPLVTSYKVLPKWCPALANGPVLDFVEGVTMVDGPQSGGVYSCGKILECRVQASPPDLDISWERNGHVVGSASVRDITMARKGGLENDNRTFLAIAELVHRICIDSLPEIHHQHSLLARLTPNNFQCQAKSVCDTESLAIESEPVAVSKRDVQHNSIKELVARWHSAPLITLITSTRMELAGHFVQMMCRASGNPSPAIQWSLLEEETGREFPIRGARFPFIWVAENGDLLVDTSKTKVASLNFVCRAVNNFGADEQTSTLILLNEDDGGDSL